MDMTASTEARSDQVNAVDLVVPRTFTIQEVIPGKATHPFDFILIESPGKAYRPNLGMRRVIIAGWGPKTDAYHGRRFTLFNEPTVIYAGAEIGGIRISHMSHLDKPLKTSLAISQKKKVPYTVQPLVETAPPVEPSADDVAGSSSIDDLKAMWKMSGPERKAQIEARVAELNAAPEPSNDQWDAPTLDGGQA